jgi:outer membrane protein TolC
LTATGGYLGSTLSSFFSLPNRFWSLGGAILETLLDGGRRRALNEQALASYDATVASHRETVLGAFAEVEDNLATLRILAQEAAEQTTAVAAAERSLAMAKNRYQRGITTYLEVVTAQTVALANQRAAVELHARQMTATVNLIKALGGGWNSAELPDSAAVTSPVKRQAPGAPAVGVPTGT